MTLTDKLSEVKEAKDLQKYFEEVADILLNKGKLVINKTEYRLTEIEFYYRDENKHNDTFTHCDKEQLKNGTWYFHASGIDITFGKGENEIYGGILLRAITLASNTDEKKNQQNDVYGPLKLRNLTECDYKNLKDNVRGKNCTDQSCSIYWKDDDVFKNMENTLQSLAVPRVGLILKGKYIDLKKEFINKPYRFIIYPMKEHKGKESIIAKDWNDEVKFKEVFGYNLAKK
ncbi:hypothetical protein [uncultured Bacteroides sp.]|uniref:hypothetical protein n=1 Tax=uncultured Bacteroides sp. TaxID=162156 RepID=UPI002AA713D5|nr:hypothetical protein [uncultured Bacteroides sp.]